MSTHQSNQQPDSQPIQLSLHQYFFAITSLLIVLAIIYGNSFHCGWHFDDHPNILENSNVHPVNLTWPEIKKSFYGLSKSSINRPLSYLTLALNYYFDQTDVFGYHLVNFAVHALTAILLFFLVYRILSLPRLHKKYGGNAYEIALLTSFLWATHPIQVPAVTYIVQRMTSLSACFSVLSLNLYLIARTSIHSRKKIICFLGFALSCLLAFASKENSFMLPINILLLDFLLLQGVSKKSFNKSFKIALPLLFIAAVIAMQIMNPFSVLSGYDHRPYNAVERLLTQPRIIVYYLSLLFYPIDQRLAFLHDIQWSTSIFTPWTTLPAIFIITTLLLQSFLKAGKYPFIAFAIIFYFLNHLIEGSIIPLEMIFEHRNYLPSLFIFALPAIFTIKLFEIFRNNQKMQSIFLVGCIAILTTIAHTTYSRNRVFSNEISLWQDNANKFPRLLRPHGELGVAYFKKGFFQEAITETKKGLTARKTDRFDELEKIYYNLGQQHIVIGESNKAKEYLEQAMELNPEKADVYEALAKVMLEFNDITKARALIEKALSLNQKQWEYHYIYALILTKTGSLSQGIKEAKLALRLNPKESLPLYIIGEACRKAGDFDRSIRYFQEFLKHHPNNIDIHLALFELYHLNGDMINRDRFAFKILSMITTDDLLGEIQEFSMKFDLSGIDRELSIRNAFTDFFKSKQDPVPIK